MNLQFNGPADGPTNMALDLALLATAEEGTPAARSYSWDGLWVTLGRFQTPEEALLADVLYVIRPTGGKAVVHGHDLTIAYAIPRPADSRSVKDLYCQLVKPLIAAFQECEVDARMACDTPKGGTGVVSADCFAFASPNDIVDVGSGLKVAGCAMRVTDRGALLQVSIPVRTPKSLVSELIKGGIDQPVLRWEFDGYPAALDWELANLHS